MNRAKIVSLGEVLWDLFPDGARFGGAPANFACHAANLGAEVTMASAVGDDGRGREAIRILQGHGVRTDLIRPLTDAPTGTVGVELSATGKPAFTIHEGSAWDALSWSENLEFRVKTADAAYFGTLGQRDERARSTIRRALAIAEAEGVPRLLDVNLRAPFFDAAMIRESVGLASMLKLSDDELGEVCAACKIALTAPPNESLAALREKFALDLVVMTRGADGAVLSSPAGSWEHPGIATKIADTVGAGDSFAASFLLDHLNGAEPEIALKNACELAAKVCAHPGAVPKLDG